MFSIGIDPGISGGICAIDAKNLEIVLLEDCPVYKTGAGKDYDIAAMAEILRRVALKGPCIIILERAQAMPKQGVVGTFNFGRGYGIWLGILGTLGIPYRTVRPSEWTGKVLKGMQGKGKNRAIQFVCQAFPGISLVPEGCRKIRDGRADAACLAYYGVIV